MKVLLLFTAFLCAAFSVRGDTDRKAAASGNVNSRYIVESVNMPGPEKNRLSRQLKADLEKIVGQKFEQGIVDTLASRIGRELHAASVAAKLSRGNDQDHVRINFEIRLRKLEEEADVTKGSYHSRQGWTGGMEAGFHAGQSQVKFGVQSDGDQLLERYAGINSQVSVPAGERVKVRFGFESFHEQWNSATLKALAEESGVPGIYRTRSNYEPSIRIALTNSLALTTGVSFERLQTQFPAARTEGAHALITTLRYHRRWDDSDGSRQELDAGYSLRAATRALDSDYVYTRHLLNASYSRRWDHQEVLVRLGAGNIGGQAPLFERFVLGNSQSLRGWNKFELDPLGGSRTIYSSTSYRYRVLEVFYDAGSVWNAAEDPVARNSVGFSLILGSLRNGLAFTVGFPLREGRVQPIFIMSANF